MAEERASVRTPSVTERRPAVASRAHPAAMPPMTAARTLQQRLGNQGTQTLAARVVARASAPGIAAASGSATGALSVSQPGDAHEREAERMADAVMRMPDSEVQFPNHSPISTSTSNPSVQRLCSDCEEHVANPTITGGVGQLQRKESSAEASQVSPSVAANIHTMQGGGSPLPPATRARFEPRFGADFSHVRVHTGNRADQTAKSISAKAFTLGPDIVFAGGQYAPESGEGQKLLAHELTHVVQQNGGQLQRASVCFLQPEKPAESSGDVEKLIGDHTTLGFLDEEGLGVDLASRLPGKTALVNGVLDGLSDSDRDDVAYEIVQALGGKLAGVAEPLRLRFVREMVYGVVTDEEEGAIARVWISFTPGLVQVAAKKENRELWKKSLWESDQLGEHIKPIKDAFGGDVAGEARAYLRENKQTLSAEALRYGIDLENKKSVERTHPDYLKSIRAIVPGVLKLKQQLEELKTIRVGYNTRIVGKAGTQVEVEATFDPEHGPQRPPHKTESPPWPLWAQVKTQHDRICALISAFANIYPTVYLLIQQDNLEALDQAADASKAQQVIFETLQKTDEKIQEADQKIKSGDISYYDLKLIQTQLLNGDAKAAYSLRFPWDQPFYQDIANDDIKGHDAREFWTDLGLSLLAAAALIAAPFTGGASAAFLVGFGLGIGAAQAGLSWDKYLKTATLGDANVKDELSLVAKGEVSGKLVEAIIQTVAVFLDAFGARAATTGAKASREAIEGVEKGLKQQLAEEAQKKAIRGAAKDTGIAAGGAGLAAVLHEMDDDEPVPDMEATASESVVVLGPDQPKGSAPISRTIIFRAPGPGKTPPGGAKQPIHLTGGEFELFAEKALLEGSIEGLPKMHFVIPGQYTGSGWGIDRIGIVFDDATGAVHVYHFEMKFVRETTRYGPRLGTPSVGTQLSKEWTEKAVDGFLTNPHPIARAGRKRLRDALEKIHGKKVDIAQMRSFLHGNLIDAPVRVIVPHWADFTKLYQQVAGLVRAGRDMKIIEVFGKRKL